MDPVVLVLVAIVVSAVLAAMWHRDGGKR